MPAIASVPPRSSASSATGTSVPTGAKRMAASSGSGGASAEPTADAAPSSSASRRASSEPRHDVHRRPLVQGDLRREVCRRAKAVDAEPAARRQRRAAQRPVADDPGAQQRGRLLVGEGGRQHVRVRLGDDRVLGEPTVGVPTGETRRDAKVLGAVRAKTAHPAGMPQPCDPDPLAEPEASRALAKLVHEPHHLMTGDDSKCPRCQFALGQVEIRPTDATSTDPYPDLSGPRNRG